MSVPQQVLELSPILGGVALGVFAVAYALVFAEERLHLRKSKPVMVAGGLIWVLVSIAYAMIGKAEDAAELLRHNLLEYAELLMFLLSAISYINVMVERNVFNALRDKLLSKKLSLRGLFWVTGVLAFFISPIADNLTTAMVMGMVVVAIGGNARFISGACVNIVVAANAGGAFSPFGDITTLMVWQKGVVSFTEFFALFIPALLSWLIPAALISFSIPKTTPDAVTEVQPVKRGGLVTVGLFLTTIALTVILHHGLAVPPFLGMTLGLGVLKIYSYLLQSSACKAPNSLLEENKSDRKGIDVFESLRDVEWDTLFFFYGIMLCVGGISALGYLQSASQFLYVGLGALTANTLIGVLSAVVDNIPLTFAVLTMHPDMDTKQWLLLTLTAGTGGSLLAIGSAAGVALMGVARGSYTFTSHLKWTWAVALGYVVAIVAHMLLN